MRIRDVFEILRIRVMLLLRQKLGWMSIIVGLLLVVLSLIVAQVSFINPLKIFWDFALGASFTLQILLGLFLSTQVFNDEKYRRTLHLVLSGGVHRAAWLLGMGLGIWVVLVIMNGAWFLVSGVMAGLHFNSWDWMMPLQSTIALSLETLVLVFLGLFISMWVKPVLSLTLAALLTVLLHSLTSLQRVFTDPQVGRFIDDGGSAWVLWAARLLPPLEWFDLKVMVGYQSSVEWSLLLQLAVLSILWSAVLAAAAWLRFDRMDL